MKVMFQGALYPAADVSRGAAYELYAEHPADGFLPNPRADARMPFRRFVHRSEVSAVVDAPPVTGRQVGNREDADDYDDPLMMPVSRTVGWAAVHRMSQSSDEHGPIAAIRRSAAIRRGTRLIKFLTPDQLAGLLHGWLIGGFCYRVHDVAHLRTPADLAVLTGQRDTEVTYGMRWRAVDASDYEVPLVGGRANYGGLVSMPSHDRVGPPVIGSGFAHCVECGLYEVWAPAGEVTVDEVTAWYEV